MNFLENIFSRLDYAGGRVIVAEAHAGGDRTATGTDLLAQIAAARAFLRATGLAKAIVALWSLRTASGGPRSILRFWPKGLSPFRYTPARRPPNSSP